MLALNPNEILNSQIPRDLHNKKDLCYIAIDRQTDIILLAQSLQRLANYINTNLSCGEPWDRVSVTGLFDNCDFNHNKMGGWHKGRWRIVSKKLKESRDNFEALRANGDNKRKTGFVLFHPNTPVCKYPKIIKDDGERERGREGERRSYTSLVPNAPSQRGFKMFSNFQILGFSNIFKCWGFSNISPGEEAANTTLNHTDRNTRFWESHFFFRLTEVYKNDLFG